VTLLLIGVDSDRLGDASNKAAPAGPANADTLMLLRVNPSGPVQVLQLPANVAVQLPGQQRPQALASLYRSGGPALVADAVRDLAGLPAGKPDRYLVMSRGSLRALVDGLGLVEVNPSRTMRYRDKSQNLTIDLQTGLQRLRANQVEQLVRWRDPERPLESRLANQEEVARGLQRELALSQPKLDLAELVAKLQGQVETNLSRTETLGLLVAALAPDRQLNFTTLPLEPPSDQASSSDKDPGQLGQLRERVETLPDLFWAEPPSSTP
jgi:LCP family protein required for cell wall assembly